MDQIHLIHPQTKTLPSESAHDWEQIVQRQRVIIAALFEVLAASEALLADLKRR